MALAWLRGGGEEEAIWIQELNLGMEIQGETKWMDTLAHDTLSTEYIREY
jgi:hypothetical protein